MDEKMIPLPSPEELKRRHPLSREGEAFIGEARQEARGILSGGRLVCILGPCSIHDPASALEYARRLKELSSEVEKSLFLVMRVYLEKSRSATGWKGFLYDPYLDGSYNIESGLLAARELLLGLTALGIPCATECVDPLAAPYFDDLITWGFIGARTTSSQPHRQLASSLPFPVGFKNNIDGNITSAVQAVQASSEPHTFLACNSRGELSALRSRGNPDTHVVLRGSSHAPNYDRASLQETVRLLQERHLPPRLMIDCSHGNARGQELKQIDVFEHTLEYVLEGSYPILGWMLESHLEGGRQAFPYHPTISMTDPCIDWKKTRELILTAHHALTLELSSSPKAGGSRYRELSPLL